MFARSNIDPGIYQQQGDMMQAQETQLPRQQFKVEVSSMERLMPRGLQFNQPSRIPAQCTSYVTQDFARPRAGNVESRLEPTRRAAPQYGLPAHAQHSSLSYGYNYGNFDESRSFPGPSSFGNFVSTIGSEEVNCSTCSPQPSLSHGSDMETVTPSPVDSTIELVGAGSSPEGSGWITSVNQEGLRYEGWDLSNTQQDAASHASIYAPSQANCEVFGLEMFSSQCFGQLPVSYYETQQPYFHMVGASQAQNIFTVSSGNPAPLQTMEVYVGNHEQTSLSSSSLCSSVQDIRGGGQQRNLSVDHGETSSIQPRCVERVESESQVGQSLSRVTRVLSPVSHGGNSQRRQDDDILLNGKKAGMTYKEIRKILKNPAAESTLRGRYRSLTKARKDRVRKPVWTEHDLELLKTVVSEELDRLDTSNCRALTRGQKLSKVSWKKVAEYIARRGGSYHFGNSTCKKKWSELH